MTAARSLLDVAATREIAAVGMRADIARPPGWQLRSRGEDGEGWLNRRTDQTAIWSIARETDGRLWLHLSTAFPDRLPSWAELVAVKEWLAGADRPAYQVIPPRATYVNLNEHVLHLWTPLDGDPPLPEFSAVVDGTRTL